MTNIFDEFQWRGLVYDRTEGLPEVLASKKVTAYIGFDPTSDSLQIGNLLALMGLARLQRFGHSPIALAGGGTGLIGDPSGKSQERQLQSKDRIAANLEQIKPQLAQFLDFEVRSNPARIVNNADWLTVDPDDGLPARRRQALHGQLHAGQGLGEHAPGSAGRHLLHRVQLHAAAGLRFPAALRPLRLHASGRAAATSGATSSPASS